MLTRAAPQRAFGREEAQALAGLVVLFATTAVWWALALWPVESGPAWLERTRYVCFGVAAGGLPDAGGWIGLTAGPLGMFAILATGWRRGMESLLRRARSSRVLASTLTALALGGVVMVVAAGVRVQQVRAAAVEWDADDGVPPDTYPRLDLPTPALALTAQTGDVVELGSLRGRPVIVAFAYAHCATICPVLVQHALQAQAELRGTTDEPAVLIVTLDPWRDPPSRLPSMAAAWGLPSANAWVLSGSVEDVEAALDAWNVPRSRSTTTGEVTHPSLLYIVDRDGSLAYASTGGVAALVSLVRRS
jgi:cytochrome oxidase Cu insertion factor (SCO1/SenC/PrrC family)